MTADKQSAATPGERETVLRSAIHEYGRAVWGEGWKSDERRRAIVTKQLNDAIAALLASPPIPAGQEVRMLTDEESDMAVCDGTQRGTVSEIIQRKFCEINAGKTIPKLAPLLQRRSEMATITKPIHVPAELHPATADLVERFAEALAAKLHKAEKKYGYTDLWQQDDWQGECAEKLLDHIEKGDPRDVAAYCAFMWHHGWKTSMQIVSYVEPKP